MEAEKQKEMKKRENRQEWEVLNAKGGGWRRKDKKEKK